jgi:hypothetical protein
MIRRQVVFDQRNEQCAIATPHGFVIYELATPTLIHVGRFPQGGAQCLAILNDSNIVAASGDDSRPGFQTNVLILWDCQRKEIVKVWAVQNPVESIVLRPDSLIVVSGDTILFYDSCNFEETHSAVNPIVGRFCIAVGNFGGVTLAALPSSNGDRLNICDYRDPADVLGSIPVAFKDIICFAFDREAELLAIVMEEGKTIQLWSVLELKLIQKFKRGMRATEVHGLAFDHMSTFLIMTTKRGTMHIFAIPPPAERGADEQKAVRAKFTHEMPKEQEFYCQFDLAGFLITAVSPDGTFNQFKLDLEEGRVKAGRNEVLGLENN